MHLVTAAGRETKMVVQTSISTLQYIYTGGDLLGEHAGSNFKFSGTVALQLSSAKLGPYQQ